MVEVNDWDYQRNLKVGESMKINKAYMPVIHFVLYIISAIAFFLILDKYVTEEWLGIFLMGVFFFATGLWGNIAKVVFLNVPWGLKSYKIVNYILIAFGLFNIIYGAYRFVVL